VKGAPVTLQQVARAAGVSPATVSRFRNGSARVSDDKRLAIAAAMEQLAYRAAASMAPGAIADSTNSMAAAPAAPPAGTVPINVRGNMPGNIASTRTIGVLTQSLVSGYFNEAMTGIEDAVKGAGYALLIMSGHWRAAEEAERVEQLIMRRVDGLVILTGNLADRQLLHFSEQVPIVAFGRSLQGARVAGFSLDNYRAACEAMDLLIEQGHRHIAFIGGPDGQEDARARLAGYRDTLARRGIASDPGLVMGGDFQESGGLLAVNRLLDQDRRFTAIFAANDLSAYGARLALYRRGIRVPDDVSLIGFDDLHSSMYTTPPLTTVRQPLYEAGICLGRMMLGMVTRQAVEVDLPALSLVVRESVRRRG